jgi:chemotaxis-related protein WspB
MLLLVFRVAGVDYAVEAGRVVEVVPRVALRSLPHAPEVLAGLLRYRGQTVPVIDLSLLFGGGPCPQKLSTRIILVAERLPAQGRAHVGLLAENVSDVRRVGDGDVVAQSPLVGQNPFLGPIVSTDSGLIPVVDVTRLLVEPIRAALAEAAP